MLDMSVQHIRILARNGKISGLKNGRDWFFEPSSIEAYRGSKSASSSATMRSRCGPSLAFGDSVWLDSPCKCRYGLLHGDAAATLAGLPEESVDTCLTSPPYWQARDYGDSNQIGLEDSIDDYVQRIVSVFSELSRVLKPNGTAWLNLGDSYITSSKAGAPKWQKNKQLSLVPFRVAIALQETGWYIRNSLVWHKPNAMPASVRDRLANTWEPLFLLSKSENYYFDLDSIRIPHKTQDSVERQRAESQKINGKAQGMKSLRKWLNSPRHRATIDGLKEIRRRPNAPTAVELACYLKANLEKRGKSIKWVASKLDQPFERVRHYFRTDKIGARLPPEETWEKLNDLLDLDGTFDESMSVEVGDNVFRNHPNGRNPGDFYSAAIGANAFSHFAVMPEKLARWCLIATMPDNGICLDPFAGICTTGRAALAQGGRFIGIDINKEFLSLGHSILRDG